MTDTDDRLVFLDEEESAAGGGQTITTPPPWRVLIVDDDADVHETTAFALRDITILNRPIEFLHAYSGAEALEKLRADDDIAVMLLDVVMETPDAGLQIIRVVRNELKLVNLRIVLRTGQPGQAPEMDAISRFDINDYKTKNELTRNKLFTTLTAALRSYDQLKRLDASRLGLEKIIAASNEFITKPGLKSFAEGVITQIAGLLGVTPEGLVCASRIPSDSPESDTEQLKVIAAAGKYCHFIDQDLNRISAPEISAALTTSLTEHRSQWGRNNVTLYFESREGHKYAAFIDSSKAIAAVDQHLLEVFCTNIALCANNIELVSALREQAFFDRLVRLPNRVAMLRELDNALGGPECDHQGLAIIDVDQFSSINDIFGHHYGDSLLRAIAERLRAFFPHCFIARVAGDVFGILGRRENLTPETIHRVFAAPFSIDRVEHPLSTSIGVVHLGDVQGDGSDGIQNAYIALKRAKSSGMGQSAYYSEAIANETRARSRMLSDLQRALLSGDQLFTVFQPQYCLGSGCLTGFETLVRWRLPDGQFVPPSDFIPIAEHSSLIVNLGESVLRNALEGINHLHRNGHTGLTVAVNVSTVQLRQPNFLAILDQALTDSGVDPTYLELEITESAAALGLDQVAGLVRSIRSRGIAVAIDDFGTGFSSLSYLDRLAVDRLKIDRAFVCTLDDGSSGRVTEMIVPLGKHLGMKVLAEGVETRAQLERLRALGCDEIQGYLIARPMPLPELEQWLVTDAEDVLKRAEAA